eukprot:404297_1
MLPTNSPTNTKTIDFSIFDVKQSSNDECNGYQQCSHLRRAYIAMKYYKLLCEQDNKEKGESLFIPFCKQIYHTFLDDYNHIIKAHQNDIKLITNELIQKYGFKQCNIGKCNTLKQHYSRNQSYNNKQYKDFDSEYMFYAGCFDQL